MKKFRVTSRRLSGFADGDIVSADGLRLCGVDLDRARAKNLIAEIGYDEPRKHKGARKDASDSDKD
jgi:hypothetical protein